MTDFSLDNDRALPSETWDALTRSFAEEIASAFLSYRYLEYWETKVAHFPITKIAPDAAEFLAKAQHFSNKDLKFAAKFCNIDIDPIEYPVDFYSTLLERAEQTPWAFHHLETEVVKTHIPQVAPAK